MCFVIGPNARLEGALMFIDGLVDSALLTDSILRPLKSMAAERKRAPLRQNLADTLSQEVIAGRCAETVDTTQDLSAGCLSGDTALILDGCCVDFVVSTKGGKKETSPSRNP
jgi:hypothetical protein